MKKIITIIFSAIIALSFAGCNNNSEKIDNTVVSVTANPDEIPDESVFQSTTESQADYSGAKGIYNFTDYEGSGIFDIKKVEINSGNAAYRAELESKCVTYEFYYLSDGYQIKAYISIPTASIKSQEPCKCLLYNRGGHWNQGHLEHDRLAYICAGTKRIVVACEIRGDNGSEGVDQFGGDDLHDVIKLIDLCENKFSFVDMDDFCVTGESRGGMMTYMAARQDDRIRKIIVAGGVSDLFAAYQQREEMHEVLTYCIGGTPEEKPEEYKKRSALNWYEDITIPVLIIHSKGDPKSDYNEQAEPIYEKLKNTTDCTFISHDDDFHGINIDPESGDMQEIIKFLNK